MDTVHDFPVPTNALPDVAPLAALLCEREYTDAARLAVLKYASKLGTLEGCTWLEPEDRAEADALLEAGFPPVADDSEAWDEDDAHWRTGGLVPPELDVEPFEPTEEDWLDYQEWSRDREAELEAAAVLVPEPEIFPINF